MVPTLRGGTTLLASRRQGTKSQPWRGGFKAWAGCRAGLPPCGRLGDKQASYAAVGQPQQGTGWPPTWVASPRVTRPRLMAGTPAQPCQASASYHSFARTGSGFMTPNCSWAGLRARYGWPWPQISGSRAQGSFCPARLKTYLLEKLSDEKREPRPLPFCNTCCVYLEELSFLL